MARRERRDIRLILGEARQALGMSQREFGPALDSSHRTAARWDTGQAVPMDHHLRRLAPLLYPRDRALAAEVADYIEETLVSLGIEQPPPPPPPPLPPAPPPAPPARPEDLVDALVLTAVEMMGAAPAPVRAMLHAVFKRGREVGLTMDAAEKALRAAVAARKGSATGGDGAT
jgi:transcriptional regulator with XRE-family HTH domain